MEGVACTMSATLSNPAAAMSINEMLVNYYMKLEMYTWRGVPQCPEDECQIRAKSEEPIKYIFHKFNILCGAPTSGVHSTIGK